MTDTRSDAELNRIIHEAQGLCPHDEWNDGICSRCGFEPITRAEFASTDIPNYAGDANLWMQGSKLVEWIEEQGIWFSWCWELGPLSYRESHHSMKGKDGGYIQQQQPALASEPRHW